MTAQAIAALAGLGVAVVGLVMYVLRQRDSPMSQYKAAVLEYEKAVQDEGELLAQIKAELDKGLPDHQVVAALRLRVRVATRRVSEARAARDRLRP